MIYNNNTYFYLRNAQGDIYGLTDKNGTWIISYSYDAWGNLLSQSTADTSWDTLADLNPLRYRGYVYDVETGLYYVSSRYYDPEICRFISADAFASTGQGLLGSNMFAYCENNPVLFSDKTGTLMEKCTVVMNDGDNGIKPINGQKRELYAGISFGLSNVGRSGCEPLAVYDTLCNINKPTSLSNVMGYMESLLCTDSYGSYIGGYGALGFFGGTPYDIALTLNHFGVKYRGLTHHGAKKVTGPANMIIGYWSDLELKIFGRKITIPKIQIHTVAVKYDGYTYYAYNYYNDSTCPIEFTSIDQLIYGTWRSYLYGFLITS